MKTFTAKITLPSGEKRFIADCVIHKGKLAQVFKKGVGKSREMGRMFNGEGDTWTEYEKYVDSYRAYYNRYLIEQRGLSQDEAKKLDEENRGDKAFENDILYSCMFVMGENPGGYLVINNDEEKARKEQEETDESGRAIRSGEKAINFRQGIFGYETERLPREIWNIIQPFGTYHKGDEADEEWADDMGYSSVHPSDLRGWFYHKGAIQALLNAGYRVSYRGKELTSEEDVQKVNEQIRIENSRHFDASKNYGREKSKLVGIRRELFLNGEHMEESETEVIKGLPEIHFPAIDVSGATIYGGGIWLHEDEKYLYIVQNNGHDGDDWSWNNYRTGGAGAVCRRVEKTDEVTKFLSDAREFEKKKIEDYYAE